MAAKKIMIQGTMSSAGKSFIAAALCRIFAQDGYKVAPFKSQNMALNSYITRDGLEMGRAQVMQAEAAMIAPTVDMNPILLKPTSNTGSQVIVHGEVVCNMTAADYYKNKLKFLPRIMESYERLAAENDIIVIEGAGSPAEINLKDNDIVNMGLAKLISAPVLLVGDIDRGGVFAQLLGTMEWLDSKERELVKGVLINKFRGDVTLLGSGISMLEERIGVPVAGVVPYADIDIDDEDSLSERLVRRSADKAVKIAVIKLPHISNFTDFNVFDAMSDVDLFYTDKEADLEQADMIIIPGTKNTIGDLLWLRKIGLENLIIRLSRKGTPIWGICGGYQMLGMSISDPLGTENGGSAAGIGLIPASTVFENAKNRRRVEGKFRKVSGIFGKLEGLAFEGYEIHMGNTEVADSSGFLEVHDMRTLQLTYDDGVSLGNIYGTYVHGIFDKSEIALTIVNSLKRKKGIEPDTSEVSQRSKYKEQQYDRLADVVRSSVDMDYIYTKIIQSNS